MCKKQTPILRNFRHPIATQVVYMLFTMSTFSSLRWQRVWVQLPTVPVKHARSSPNAARSVGGTLFLGRRSTGWVELRGARMIFFHHCFFFGGDKLLWKFGELRAVLGIFEWLVKISSNSADSGGDQTEKLAKTTLQVATAMAKDGCSEHSYLCLGLAIGLKLPNRPQI